MKRVTIRKGHESRIIRGHPWIFSNEVLESPKHFSPGELVEVRSASNALLGGAFVNPHSLILARVYAREPVEMDGRFFRDRIAAAAQRRARLMPGATSCRLVYSEGDELPGLIVDRYDDQLVVQTQALGMDTRLAEITGALVEVLRPRAVVERNDAAVRALEGLPPRAGILFGETDGCAIAREGELELEVDLLAGQKTGHFFDQSRNRTLLRELVGGRRVLDLFCYAGAWGLAALRWGAREAIGVDSSRPAIERARANARRNGVETASRWLDEDVPAALDRMRAEGERFGVVVLDPPAYVKSRKRLFAGLRRYRIVNEQAIAVVERGGFLVTSSCSYHVGAHELIESVAEAARRAGRRAVVVARGGLPPDHPVPAALPEADYLKCFVLEIG
jgi:23S rRNA (cytosine1962-C5)-methyltransferase